MKVHPKQKSTPRKRRAKAKTAGKSRKRRKAFEIRAKNASTASDRLMKLAHAIVEVSAKERVSVRTTRLIGQGVPKMAQKVVEEAAEVGIEAVRGDVNALISESADLFYNLVALWTALGVSPDDVWAEMDHREMQLGMAEKRPKPPEYYADLVALARNR